MISNIFVMFIPISGEMTPFDDHIFQLGWLNHQLDYIPRPQLTSIFEGQPSKTRPFPTKTRGPIWVPGMYSFQLLYEAAEFRQVAFSPCENCNPLSYSYGFLPRQFLSLKPQKSTLWMKQAVNMIPPWNFRDCWKSFWISFCFESIQSSPMITTLPQQKQLRSTWNETTDVKSSCAWVQLLKIWCPKHPVVPL